MNINNKFCLFLTLLLSLFASTTNCAEVKEFLDTSNYPSVKIEGEIVEGDYLKFRKVVSKHLVNNKLPLRVVLNSRGGNVVQAILIGRYIRQLMASTQIWGNNIISSESEAAKTVLLKQADVKRASAWSNWRVVKPSQMVSEDDLIKCYSSCVLIFLAGTEKSTVDNTDDVSVRRFIPVIGLHRPYFNKEYFAKLKPQQAAIKYKQLESLVDSYLKDIGVSSLLIERMLKPSSDSIELVSSEEFEKYYNKKEPFVEEFMLAKCGSAEPNKFLTGQDKVDYLDITNKRRQEFDRRYSDNQSLEYAGQAYESYIPNGYETDYVHLLIGSVRDKVKYVEQCNINTLYQHQLELSLKK